MHAIDFVYDHQQLSDYGFIICHFDGAPGVETINTGSQITFNTVSRHSGKLYGLTSTQYDTCITTTFNICKNPCNNKYMEITSYEYRNLVRWLNRKQFLPFSFCIDCIETDQVYYDASFNVSKMTIDGKVYALELAMTTNRPFGYGEEIVHIFNADSDDSIFIVNDLSDEIGYIYPDMTITCLSDGDIQIVNQEQECTTLIQNCIAEEVITIHGDTQIVESSVSAHKIYNDFNFQFFKIGNTFDNRKNSIVISQPCTVELRYKPIIKDLM